MNSMSGIKELFLSTKLHFRHFFQHSPFDGMTSAELCGFTLKDILIAKSKKVENNFVEQSTDEFDNEIVELTFDVDKEIRESIETSRCPNFTNIL